LKPAKGEVPRCAKQILSQRILLNGAALLRSERLRGGAAAGALTSLNQVDLGRSLRQ
jgi:hypothetical protein